MGKHVKPNNVTSPKSPTTSPTNSTSQKPDVSIVNSTGRRPSTIPKTKEQYEQEQSVVRDEVDPYTGRVRYVCHASMLASLEDNTLIDSVLDDDRKIRGTGEVIESIVSKQQHKEINKQATFGDGAVFSATLYGKHAHS